MASIYRPYTLFDTKQEVYYRASTQPFVGFERTEDLPEGWLFDIKRWSSLFDLKLPVMPRLHDPSTQGLPEWDYFESGVGSTKTDLLVRSIEERFIDHERLWLPQIDHGWYYRYRTDYFYYSDNSRVQYIDPTENESGRNVVTLEAEVEPSKPILAASFTRDNEFSISLYDVRCKQMGEFSGLWAAGEQLDTTLPATQLPIWANVDTTKREFVVDRSVDGVTKLLFNDDYIESVGVTPASIQDFGTGDILGASTGASGQLFKLKRFPVIPSTFSLYVVDADASTWEEWTRVDTYQDLVDYMDLPYAYGNKYYYLDKDLGRVVLGDAESGIPPFGHYLVAIYDVTFRIEYEEKDCSTNIEAWDADCSPVTQTTNQGFVCISHEELEPASISLKISKNLIPLEDPAVYGPLYVGNDYATLRAEVLSSTDTPVPNVEVEFSLTPSSIGAIGGSSNGLGYATTDGNGHAYTFYQPPVDAEEMGFYASSEDAVQGDQLHLDNPEAGLTLDDDIYLYKVLKDDPFLGMTFHDYLVDNLPTPPWWADPVTYPHQYEIWKDQMVQLMQLAEWDVSPNPNGRKVIVYNWSATAINPVLGGAGAFIPTRPLSVDASGGVLTYPTGALLPSDPYYMMAYPPYFQDIGAYWVAATKYIEFRASCWSTFYNRRIYSNIIRARIQLPRYLLGEYVNEQLYKIPFGWKLYQDGERNHAAGLDGATFLTINPHSGPYQIVDLVIDSDDDGVPDYWDPYEYQDQSFTGDWASAPWSGISFKVTVV